MGNEQARGKDYRKSQHYGQIYMKLSKSYFVPGEQLSGEIYLDLRSHYPADKIQLLIKGREKYLKVEMYKHGDHIRYRVVERKHNILSFKIPVFRWQTPHISPGQYVFPFSFLLPRGIPGSFFQEGDQCLADIEYKIEAVLDTDDHKIPKLKYKERMVVTEPLKANIKGSIKSKTGQISTWCCCNQGTTSITVRFEKDAYFPGDTAKMLISLDNSLCTVDCIEVTCTLVQNLILNDGSHKYKNLVRIVRAAGADAGSKYEDKMVEMHLPSYNPGSFKNKGGDEDEASIGELRRMRFKVGALVPSVNGKIVDSEFHLDVKMKMAGCICCCTDIPNVKIPVQIYAPAIQNVYAPVQAPLDWAPQMMPTNNMTLDNQYAFRDGGGNYNQYPQQQNMGMMNNQMQPNMNGMGYPQPQQQQGYPQQGYPQPVTQDTSFTSNNTSFDLDSNLMKPQ